MRRSSICAALVLCAGCGAVTTASPRASVTTDTREEATEAATPDVVQRLTISSVVVEAPAAVCERPPTVCTDASACVTQPIELDAHENWCPGSPIPTLSAQIGAVTGLVAIGDAVWIQTDRGPHRWSGTAWVAPPATGREVAQLSFGSDVWRMPPQIVLTECVTPVVHCRSGGRKCAAPMPECRPTDEIVIAVHGPRSTPVTLRNPLLDGGVAVGTSLGSPMIEALVAMAGTSANDVWILSSARLFHWDGAHATARSLDVGDPFVELVADPTGVYVRARSGRRAQLREPAWQELPEQPGPFVGAQVDAPAHPFVTLEHAQATGTDSFWATGHVRTFGGRYDIAPAIVRYENDAFVTFVGALAQPSWLRADAVDVDALRPEGFRVLVDDAAMAPGAFPFVTVRWQELRGLARIADGPDRPDRLVVSTPVGIFGLEGGTWTREASGMFEVMAAGGDLVAVLGAYSTVSLREPGGWCPALRSAPGSAVGLVVARERAWLASEGRLVSVRSDHSAELFELQLGGRSVHIELLLAYGDDLMVFVRDQDGEGAVASFDGERWTTTGLGAASFGHVVGSSAEVLAGDARFDGQCWTQLTAIEVPLIEVAEAERPVFSLVGETDVELRMELEPAR